MTKNNTQPTDTQIQVVMSDWLGTLRKGEDGNYTHKGKGGITRVGEQVVLGADDKYIGLCRKHWQEGRIRK